jgi:serine phosphatase RsbU (regulator of sigma subunit)
MLQISFGVAKVNKYASRESGDTVEIVERPVGLGGFTAILVDGQGSGKSAKNLSNFVAGHCTILLKQGVRDSVVARAANDQLYTYRAGQVSATLNLLTADFATNTLVVTRNNPNPVYIVECSETQVSSVAVLEQPSVAIGLNLRTRPVTQEFELKAGTVAVAVSDGISSAGQRYNPNQRLDVEGYLREYGLQPAQQIADALLERALDADKRRPADDMSVVVLEIRALDVKNDLPIPRKMSISFTFDGVTKVN